MAATEAMSLGYGGVSLVSRACGLSRKAIRKGIVELAGRSKPLLGRVRRAGGGRKSITQSDPGLVQTLEALIDEQTRGDPESALRWICKSTRSIAGELGEQDHPVSHMKVAQILHDLNYSLQGNRKTEEGADHPDRDAQFRHINATVKKCLGQGIPVISVDTKKKELLGNYHNAGQQWLSAKQPIEVQGHDFPSPAVPRAYPYGIYDIGRNAGFVNVGTDHDTGAFAVASIRGWWRSEGRHIYPQANSILITADGGGSNGWRLRLWKLELQKLADQTAMDISVCHFPPGTSKWNKIEHRLFSFISSNWRGEPLRDYETIVNLIAATTTAKGLKVTCRLDRRKYPIGREVTNQQMKQVNLERNKFHGEWNYLIKPTAKKKT
jgi:Rhodopirellula transposase DDE domain